MKKYVTYSFLMILSSLFSFNLLAENPDPAHDLEIISITYSSSGKYLVSGGKDLKIRLWDAPTGKMLYAKDVEFLPLKVIISPDDKYAILSQNAGKNVLIDLKTGEKVKDLMIEEAVAFTNDSKSIITVSNADDGKEKYLSYGFADINDESFINYFSYSRIYTNKILKAPAETKDGKYLLLADHSKEIYLFKKDSVEMEEKIHIDRVADVVTLLEGDSSFLINGSSKYYKISDGSSHDFLEVPTIADEQSSLYLNQNKLINFSSSYIRVYDATTGKIIFQEDLTGKKQFAVDPTGIGYTYSDDYFTLKTRKFGNEQESTAFSATDIIEKIAFQNYQKAIYYMNKGKYLKAKDLLSQVEKKSNKEKKLYYLLGENYLQMGFHDQALRYFLMDYSVVPGRAAYKIAQGFAASGDAETAVRWLDSAAKAGIPVNAFEISKDKLFDPIKSSPLYAQKIAELSSRECEKYVNISEERLKNKEDLAALEYLSKAIASDETNANLYRMRAKLYLKLKEYEKARQDYLNEAKYDEHHKAESLFNVALTYSKKGDLANTIVWIRKGIESDSTYLSSLIDIAELYEASYKRDIAISILNEYLKIVPIDHYAIYLRASMMPVQETAKAEMTKAIEYAKEQGEQVPPQYTELMQSLAPVVRK